MKLTLAEPRLLKESVGILAELVNEATFKIDKDRIEVVAMDPANVAMVIFKLLSSAFVEYEVGKKLSLSVSIDSLNQILKRAKPTDTLILEHDEKKNRLTVQLRGQSTRTFHLALIDLDETEQKIPDLKFPVTIEMPSLVFNDAIEDMDVIAESVALVAESEKFTVESEGRLHAGKVEMLTDEGLTIRLTGATKAAAKYSVEYLKKIIKGSRLAETMQLSFNQDYPLAVEYKVLDKLLLRFILAPRVDNT